MENRYESVGQDATRPKRTLKSEGDYDKDAAYRQFFSIFMKSSLSKRYSRASDWEVEGSTP